MPQRLLCWIPRSCVYLSFYTFIGDPPTLDSCYGFQSPKSDNQKTKELRMHMLAPVGLHLLMFPKNIGGALTHGVSCFRVERMHILCSFYTRGASYTSILLLLATVSIGQSLALRAGPTCPTQWQHDYIDLQRSIVKGSVPPEDRRYAIAVSSPPGLAGAVQSRYMAFFA